jgi:riboflavin transporter FmnP
MFMEKRRNIRKLVILALLSSIAYMLILLNFPLSGLPPFLKIDFSEVPALVAAVVFGPGAEHCGIQKKFFITFFKEAHQAFQLINLPIF